MFSFVYSGVCSAASICHSFNVYLALLDCNQRRYMWFFSWRSFASRVSCKSLRVCTLPKVAGKAKKKVEVHDCTGTLQSQGTPPLQGWFQGFGISQGLSSGQLESETSFAAESSVPPEAVPPLLPLPRQESHCFKSYSNRDTPSCSCDFVPNL